MLVSRNPGLAPSLLLGYLAPRRSRLPEHLASKQVILLGYGRTALYLGLKALGLPQGSSALLPSYITRSALSPFLRYGISPQFYDLDPRTLAIDWPALEHRLSASTRALMIVHYFGFPGEIERAREFCGRHGLALIEDAAHSFLSAVGGQYLGAFGDIGIYSMRKMVPIPNGGALILGKGWQEHSLGDLGHLSTETDGRRIFALLGRYIESHAGLPFPRLPSLSPAVSHSPVTQPDSLDQFVDYGFSPWSRRILCRLDLADVARRRRENYELLAELLPFSKAINPLWCRLPAGVCPQALPLLTVQRDAIAKALSDRGIDAHGWPSIPLEVDQQEFRGAAELAEKVLLLPIHQELGRGAMQYVARAISDVLKRCA